MIERGSRSGDIRSALSSISPDRPSERAVEMRAGQSAPSLISASNVGGASGTRSRTARRRSSASTNSSGPSGPLRCPSLICSVLSKSSRPREESALETAEDHRVDGSHQDDEDQGQGDHLCRVQQPELFVDLGADAPRLTYRLDEDDDLPCERE